MNVKKLTLMGVGVALNVVGAFIAVTLKLPIYMDSIGTILISCLLGPKLGVLTGLCGSIVSGITFDIYSLFFAPVQISTGYISGIMYKKGFLKGFKTIVGVFAFALPTSILSALITAYLFGGVTSAGSSYIVQILNTFGIPSFYSIFVTQFFTDYLDKFLAVVLVGIMVKNMPKNMRL